MEQGRRQQTAIRLVIQPGDDDRDHQVPDQPVFQDPAHVGEDADVLIYRGEIGEQALKDEAFFNKIKSSKIPVLLLLNKIDKSDQTQLEEQVQSWTTKVPNAEIYPISALEGFVKKGIMILYNLLANY